MKEKEAKVTVDSYIKEFPADTRKALTIVRNAILKSAPGVTEQISYGMPAYKFRKYLVFFAGYKKHVGFYPMPSAIKAFKKDIVKYKSAKGSVQFPLDQPMPVALIKKMVKFRMKDEECGA